MGDGNDFADLGQEMVESMFNISWTFTLPGKITNSNADLVEGNSATWYFDIDTMENDRYLMVQSTYINWPLIIGIIAGGIAGFLYYRFIGCASGSCKIASNPYISTIYWALLGGFLASAL